MAAEPQTDPVDVGALAKRDGLAAFVLLGEPLPSLLSIVPLDDFLNREDEKRDPLLGSDEETYLPAAGLIIVGGEGGASKTTLTIDAIAHLASGTPWLGLDVARPVRIVVIENEGPRVKFKQKLAEKDAAWEGRPWRPNVYVLHEPWGAFSFRDETLRAELRAFCRERQVDLVVGDPLGSLGVAGAGSPDETREFLLCLRDCGLFDDLAFWLLHHPSKAGHRSVVQALSGAWGGHPDAIAGVELDGNERTKLTWAKLRWATPVSEPWPLEWDTDTRGFRRGDPAPRVTDDELQERLDDYLTTVDPAKGASKRNVREDVRGSNERLDALLRRGLEDGRYTDPTGGSTRPRYARNVPSAQTTPGNVPPDARAHSEEGLEWR